MHAPTIQQVAKSVLRDWGILYLNPTTPASQTNPIRATDLEACAHVLSAAFQEIADEGGIDAKTQTGSAVLNAPTSVTLTVTDGSSTISALTTYADWMLGCTIRIAGDDRDNEVISSTALATPVNGASGSVSATVYADAVTLDQNTGKVIAPLLLSDGTTVIEATNRHDFLARGKAGAKLTATQPSIYFMDSYYDQSLDYIVRRIRLSPLPTSKQVISWVAAINPQRVKSTDIDAGSHNETNIKIPCVNGWVESIFLPVARQIATGYPQFKNEEMRGEIGRQYIKALRRLKDATGSDAPAKTRYV